MQIPFTILRPLFSNRPKSIQLSLPTGSNKEKSRDFLNTALCSQSILLCLKLLSFALLFSSCKNESPKLNEKASQPTKPTKVTLEDSSLGLTGQVQDFENFPSKFVESRTISVWLPKDYDAHPERKYAVWYMHDGQNLFIPSRAFIGVDWGVDETMTALVDSGKIGDVIVVGIYNTSKRTEEYAPKKAFDLVPNSIRKNFAERFGLGMVPISDEYLKFLVTEVKPFIDSTYRTKRDASNTFVAGSSMGGLISAYAICEYPSIFGAAACISTHFPAGDGIMIDYLNASLPSPTSHKIYFDFGTKTLDSLYEPYQLRADSVMKAKGYTEGSTWLTKKFVGDEHSERAWRKRFSIPVTFLMSQNH